MMQTIKYPLRKNWQDLIKRPVMKTESLNLTVKEILDDVKLYKDSALFAYAKQFENTELESLAVLEEEKLGTEGLLSKDLIKAINNAKLNIEKFHRSQIYEPKIIETAPGVTCWQKSVPIEKVGLYIPGGSAPLFSSVLMLAVPAKLAGCKEIVLCTPPNKTGKIHPGILYTAILTGITKIFKVGGAQAIAAMAYGTETIPNVYKIFGPGNQYVTKAKELVQSEGIAIDMPAGPSEVLIIADETCDPAFVAADLLSQAEHGPDSQVVLLSDKEMILTKTLEELEKQLVMLPRKKTAEQSLAHSKAILMKNLDECIAFNNMYAPEHLIIASIKSEIFENKIMNAGSVFLGNYSCESAGDYASGTNHTLPTNGYAKNHSGVSTDSFLKKISFQKITKQGIASIGKTIEILADAESLFAHKNAVSIRLKTIKNV